MDPLQVDDGADFAELPDSDPDIQDYSAATQASSVGGRGQCLKRVSGSTRA